MFFISPAIAQTTVNPGALDQLNPSPATSAPAPAPQQQPARPTRPTPPSHPVAATPPKPNPPPKPATPVVPAGPPPPAVLAPLSPPPPAHPNTPPPPAPVLADAPGIVSALPDGTRITFGPQRSDLNPATNAAISDLAHKSPDGTFNVLAYAAGNTDDPSTPRRLSLSRALNARSVLIAAGIPSTHIYVRALGPNITRSQPDIPPDRVDITVTATQSPPKQTPDAQPVSTTPK